MMDEIVLRLRVRDLVLEDLPGLEWSGGPTHLAAVANELTQAGADYLGAFLPSGRSVGKAGITYAQTPAAGVIWQVAVDPALQSCGIGTGLMLAAEQRIAQRGLTIAQLGVELNNPRAKKLYEHLGYREVATEDSAWDQDRPDGTVYRYETVLTIMRKSVGGEGE